MRLILASTSPRRRELLILLGLHFDVIAPVFEEVVQSGRAASEQATEFARGKARAVAAVHPDAAVVGSDTLIEVDRRVVGKPQTLEEAWVMLADLRGRHHRIHTAVAVCRAGLGFEATALSTVEVRMRAWSQAEVEAYLATGESLGKAGGYAIQGQGAGLIDGIDGDYTAAVGLPLRDTAMLLAQAGCPVPVSVEDLYRDRPSANWARFAPV